MSDSNQTILTAFFEKYFQAQSGFNGSHLMDYWRPGGILHTVGNAGEFHTRTIEKQIEGMKAAQERIPGLKVDFVIDEIEQIAVHDDLIASVHIRYRMIFPDGYGKHRSFFSLTKIDQEWGIVSALDRGFEV